MSLRRAVDHRHCSDSVAADFDYFDLASFDDRVMHHHRRLAVVVVPFVSPLENRLDGLRL